MRYLFTIIALAFLSCSVKTEKREAQYWPGGEIRVVYTVELREQEEVKVFEQQYHESGELLLEGVLENDKRQGEWNSFYPSGDKWSRQVFNQGKRTGPCLNWYENGNLRFEGQYVEDKPSGIWKFYEESGQLAQEKDYDS